MLAFLNINQNAILLVPECAIDAYKSQRPWSEFTIIKAIETVNINAAAMCGIDIQSASGFITITGLEANEKVDFYATDGKALGSAKSTDGSVSFSAKQGSVVVAKIGKESVKIAVK